MILCPALPCPMAPYMNLITLSYPMLSYAALTILPYHTISYPPHCPYSTLPSPHYPPLTHVGDAWSDMREEFKRRSTFRLKEQLIDESTIDDILLNRLSLKIMHFDHLTGSPTQVVSQLMLAGYADSFDYFYQVLHFSVV